MSSIAIVYDHLTTQHGGAEVVLAALLTAFPHARLYSTVSSLDGNSWLGKRPVTTSFLQMLPRFLRKRHQLHALLTPLAVESLHITESIIISVTAGAAKGVITRPGQLHMCYLLTPTRYLYDPESAIGSVGILQLPGLHWLANQALRYLRWWDYVAAQRPDHYIPISRLVGSRLEQTYNRPAETVLYPPFIPEHAAIPEELRKLELPTFIFSLGRQVWYKRIDVLIEYAKASHQPTIIAGEGAASKQWQRLAGAAGIVKKRHESLHATLSNWNFQQQPILFVGKISRAEAVLLFQRAQAFVMPGIEDFGLTALEALYYGCPAIVHRSSGVAEVLNSSVAQFLETASVADLTQAVSGVKDMKISHTLLKNHALRYSEAQFTRQFTQYIQKRS